MAGPVADRTGAQRVGSGDAEWRHARPRRIRRRRGFASPARGSRPPRRHRPGARPQLRRLGAERRRHGDRADRSDAGGRARPAAGHRHGRRPARRSTSCSASCVPRGLVPAGHARAPGSSPSAVPSPATSTARTTTSTARSAGTSGSWTMMLADGSVVTVGPDRWPELFWATVGGMGLTGSSCGRPSAMLPIETSRCTVDTERVGDLDALLEAMETGDAGYRYSVAWIDLVARGAALGRSVLTRGRARPPRRAVAATGRAAAGVRPEPARDRAAGRPCPAACSTTPRSAPSTRAGSAPPRAGASVRSMSITALLPPARRRRPLEPPVRPARLRCSTSSWCRSAPRRRCAPWSGAWRRRARPSFLAVLKRFGASNPAPLSLPVPGLDAGARHPRRHARPGRAARRARRARARRRWPALPRQGQRHHARRDPPRLPAARRVAARPRRRRSRTAGG